LSNTPRRQKAESDGEGEMEARRAATDEGEGARSREGIGEMTNDEVPNDEGMTKHE